jgi:DNA-binding ferritin-like protein
MPKTFKRRTNNNFSRKNNGASGSLSAFQKQITIVFFEMIMMVKLFHWKTHSYATHKATDELYASLNEHIDSFIEVLLGKTGSRIDLMNNRTIKLIDLNSQEQLKSKIMSLKSYLVGLDNSRALSTMSNSDLFNIRDEILGDLNKFLYLLTFK